MAERNETLENEQAVREYFEKRGWKVTKPDIDRGVVRKYRPVFLIRLATGDMLILETKGQDTEQDRVKWKYLDEWVEAVNQQGGFGRGGGMWRSSRGTCWTSSSKHTRGSWSDGDPDQQTRR